MKFQSTHPMRDATLIARQACYMPLYFNPRIPCGMRRTPVDGLPDVKKFQSTHPMRDATYPKYVITICSTFQSTHPMRDATTQVRFQSTVRKISIHASHAGCDHGKGQKDRTVRIFQSTHPMRDATDLDDYVSVNQEISIHASHAGCD